MWFRRLSGWRGVLGRWCAPLHAAALQTRQRRLRRSFQNALLSQRRQPVQPKLWWVEWDSSEHTEYLSVLKIQCFVTCRVSCAYRWGAPSTPSETSWVHSLVIRSGNCAATWQHRQTGAQLLCAHGRSEWRQVDWSSLLPHAYYCTQAQIQYCAIQLCQQIFRLYFIYNCSLHIEDTLF